MAERDCHAEEGAVPKRQWVFRLSAQLAVALPQMGWVVSEARAMPLILRERIPPVLLSSYWLCSPIAGVFLHPLVGRLTDRWGRKPFILCLGGAGAGGLISLPYLVSRVPGPAASAAVFLPVFGLLDTCHDLLLTPTRAAMNDAFPPEESECRSAVAMGLGKMFGLLCVLWFDGEGAFVAVGLTMLLALAPQLLVPSGMTCPDADGGVQQPGRDLECQNGGSTLKRLPRGFISIFVLSCAGWLGCCLVSFGATSAWAQHTGALPGSPAFEKGVRSASLALLGGAIVLTLGGGLLPHIVRGCGGHFNAFMVCNATLAVSLASFAPRSPLWAMAASLVVLASGAELIQTNVGYDWLESRADFNESERGHLTGALNSSLPVGQILAAILTGPVVRIGHGQVFTALACGAFICGGAVVCAMIPARERRAPIDRPPSEYGSTD